jgi:hypothetical protein
MIDRGVLRAMGSTVARSSAASAYRIRLLNGPPRWTFIAEGDRALPSEGATTRAQVWFSSLVRIGEAQFSVGSVRPKIFNEPTAS